MCLGRQDLLSEQRDRSVNAHELRHGVKRGLLRRMRSYERSSGPQGVREASTTSASPVRAGWTTY